MSVQFSAHVDTMDNHELHPRRNPLTPAMLKQKRAEVDRFKQKNEGNIPDVVYAFGYEEDGKPVYTYCGITNDYNRRCNDHLAGILDPDDLKQAYVNARELQAQGKRIKFWLLGPAADITEREWCEALIADGHPLQNEGTTIDNRRRKKKMQDLVAQMKSKPLKPSPMAKQALSGKLNFEQFKALK